MFVNIIFIFWVFPLVNAKIKTKFKTQRYMFIFGPGHYKTLLIEFLDLAVAVGMGIGAGLSFMKL